MKKLIVVTTLALLVLAGCNLVTALNPIVGTWKNDTLGIITTYVFNDDETVTQTTGVGDLGVTTSGTWSTSDSSLSVIWAGDTEPTTYAYSFNSDKTTLTLTNSGTSFTYTKQ